MKITGVECGERAFFITWADELVAEFPFIWLRDNDRNELHPLTRERTFDLTSVDLDISPKNFEPRGDELIVHWPGKSEPSIYTSDWLRACSPGRPRPDPAAVRREFWNRETLRGIPRVGASSCAGSPAVLREALLTAKRVGLLLIEGLEDRVTASEDFAALIGFRRETNFGVTYDVVSKADPNNLAYTSVELPLHTDLPNQESIPGYQFLHSYRNSVDGGESVFADGFSVCADFEEEEPENFELLKRVRIPWRFHDDSWDIRQHRPVISQNDDGDFECFVFNAHIADVPDMEIGVLYDFYAAYRDLMIRVRDPKYSVRHALQPGEMVVFDNHRIVHSRTAFDPESGDRHFHGYYIEHNEVDSRIRVLSRSLPDAQERAKNHSTDKGVHRAFTN